MTDKHDVEKLAYQGTASLLHFTRFANEFSKWVSLIFVLLYCLSWTQVWAAYWAGMSNPAGAMSFILQPTLVVLSFYFGTKMIENVSKGLCAWMMKRLEVTAKPISFNSGDGYDYGYGDYTTGSIAVDDEEMEGVKDYAGLGESGADTGAGERIS